MVPKIRHERRGATDALVAAIIVVSVRWNFATAFAEETE